MPLKFEKRSSAAVEAIAYSLQMGAKISTNSWGFSFRSEALRLALEQAEAKGQLFVAAVDNAGADNTTYAGHAALLLLLLLCFCCAVAAAASADSGGAGPAAAARQCC